VIGAFKARGMSDAEAERRYNRVTDVADAMKVPPSQRTEEQTAVIEKAKGDPTFEADIQVANAFAQKQPGANATADLKNNPTIVAASEPKAATPLVAPVTSPPEFGL
jgi:hypothetical protein